MRRIVLLPILALLAVFFIASPASAATVDSFTIDGSVDDQEVFAGQSLEIDWTVSSDADPAGVVEVEATGTATGTVDNWEGVLPGAPVTVNVPDDAEVGDTFTFGINAFEDGQEDDLSDEITVTVIAPTEIPAPQITFPTPCTVALPDVENVNYGVGFGNSGSSIEQTGTLNLADFYNRGFETTFGVNPNAGFAFPEGAQTTFPVVVSEDCFPEVIETQSVCKTVEFTNTTENAVFIGIFSDNENFESDDEFALAAGETRTVDSERDRVFFTANDGEDLNGELIQAGYVDVDQDCTPAAGNTAHPTVAPAAGAGDDSTAGATGVLALAALIGTGLLALRQHRAA
ncbi:hypothetical protein [Aeromicrobium sp. CF3.5]|uniref:hypothetical protein n=1 Tax=Aeromicrobium sp. CF3.5 TaxID=3373078 RepID=UPI003EE764A4